MRSAPKSEKLRFEVVFAWNYLEWGGAQMYFLGIARRISDSCDVRLVFPRGTDAQFVDFCRSAGVPFIFLETPADIGEARGIVGKLRRHLRKIRSEFELVRNLLRDATAGTVLHVELSPWQSVLALWLLSRRHPVFSTMHNRLPEVGLVRRAIWRFKFAFVARMGNFRLFPSNRDALASLARFAPKKIAERAAVTYTNVDPDEIARALDAPLDIGRERERFGIGRGAFVVVTVGQFIDRKGRWEALEAARRLAGGDDAPVFVWVTNSSISDGDRQRVEAAGAGASFRMIASSEAGAAHLDLMRFLRIADAFALPSHVEGLPISLLEAMAMGLPCVSTRVNAIPEAVIDGETGLLIPPRDAGALADAVARLVHDRELGTRLGRAGRAKVLAEFVETEVAKVAHAAYERSLEAVE